MSTRDAESIQRILDRLVQERQQLRRTPENAAALEANRLALIYWQHALQQTPPGEHMPAA